MITFARGVRFELSKPNARLLLIAAALMGVVQPLLSYVSGVQAAQIGVDATMESEPSLYAPLPPLEYFGFDVLLVGQLVVVVLAALAGGGEFGNGELRTTMLAVNDRTTVVAAKLLAFTLTATALVGVTSWLTIAVQHLALGSQGFDPVTLDPLVWSLLARQVASTVLLGGFTYALSLLLRGRVLPLVIMLPQLVGPAKLIEELWRPATYLPVLAGNQMTASPTGSPGLTPAAAGLVVALWAAALWAVAWIAVTRRDLGAR